MARDKPDSRLAERVLPVPLRRALRHIFEQGIEDCMLVGGTALAGYYAGHRRSDDLDLFVRDSNAHRAATLAVQSLSRLDARVVRLQSSAQFLAASCLYDGHDFSVQVVLDRNLFAIGTAQRADDGVWVADLDTLVKMKAATLMSRCGEKDLYDLLWVFSQRPELDVRALVEMGAQVDGGMTAEGALTSLVGTRLNESSCGFSMTQTTAEVLRDISRLKTGLEQDLSRLARDQPVPPIGVLIDALRRSESE